MHAATQLLFFWALAFGTLVAALVLLNLFYALIGNDLCLRSVWQEALIAAISALVEGGSVWLVLTFARSAGRALFIPALIVAIIYQCTHLEDWNRYDTILFLVFQIIIASSVSLLFSGHFKELMMIWVGFGFFLIVFGSFARSL